MTDDGGVRHAADGRNGAAGSFGPNAWLVDDMYDRSVADPSSVSESWREFFSDYRPAPVPPTVSTGSQRAAGAPPAEGPSPRPPPPVVTAPPAGAPSGPPAAPAVAWPAAPAPTAAPHRRPPPL